MMKILSFYLPQFHRVSVNDRWWGEGFTEWTSVCKAKPLFDNHYQPHIPLDSDYYDLLNMETMEWQSDLMEKYDVDGMCFYHYWFSSDKRVLEKPAENLLEWKHINMPFCFSWANESWLNKWSFREGLLWQGEDDLSNKELRFIFFQTYGREKEWKRHFDYLYPFFCDDRYIKVDNKPLFVIHDLYNIPCLHEMIMCWNELALGGGFSGIYVLGGGIPDISEMVDSYMTHEPGMIREKISVCQDATPKRLSYIEATDQILSQKYVKGKKTIYTTFCSYDTTPRYGMDGDVYDDSTPEIFGNHLSRLMARNEAVGNDFIFIDAWNEWGEGMHLEPDQKYGYKWLEAVKKAKNDYGQLVDLYRNTIDYYDSNEIKLMCQKRKWQLYVSIYDRWMKLRHNHVNILEYFEKNSINKILLYGLNSFVDRIVEENDNYILEIMGVIDKNPNSKSDKIQSFRLGDDLPETDAILVTAVYYLNDICEDIRSCYGKIPIFSLTELIQFSEESYYSSIKAIE